MLARIKVSLSMVMCVIIILSILSQILNVYAQTSSILPPLKQLESGILPQDIKCGQGFAFVLKSENQSPACVKTDSVTKLVSRGWAKLATENNPTGSEQSQSNKIVTLDQNNQVINLKKGEGFLLNLGENYQWSIDVGNQTVLSRVMNIMVIKGAQGIYDAHNVGQTTLSATGDPICRTETPPCGTPSILFRININVSF